MFAAVAYIAYKEYERKQHEEALKDRTRNNIKFNGQRDNLLRHRQRQRKRIRRVQKEDYKERHSHQFEKTNLCGEASPRATDASPKPREPTKKSLVREELLSVSPPLKRLSELTISGEAVGASVLTFGPSPTAVFNDPTHILPSSDRMAQPECETNNTEDNGERSTNDQPSETAFRDDVRVEWIRAVFGTKFPVRDTSINPTIPSGSKEANGSITNISWKGMGLAGIPAYVSYTADLELSKDNGLTSSEPQRPSMGMTLSRLSLGLYVRYVHPGSEAWCAGVEENAVLVGINDGELNLLAEPSKLALERIWQYEGISLEVVDTSRSNIDHVKASGVRFGAKKNVTQDGRIRGNNGDIAKGPISLTLSSSKHNSKMKIRNPISMTFIKNGKLHKVIFLGDPPYGIDWGPCGKFCLVQRVKPGGVADLAGVRSSSIIAGIRFEDESIEQNSKTNMNTIYDLDHLTVAATLKEMISTHCKKRENSNTSDAKIRIQLCFTPSQARSGHWERKQDELEDKSSRPITSNEPKISVVHDGNTSGTKMKLQQTSRPQVAAELDGVQVRIHPLLGGGGSVLGSGRRPSLSSRRRSLSPSKSSRRRITTSGCLVPPSSKISNLAERVAAGEIFSIWRNKYDHPDIGHGKSDTTTANFGSDQGRFYRTCPKLANEPKRVENIQKQQSTGPYILDCWDAEQAFIYIFCHHLAGYNEKETRIFASSGTSFLMILQAILEQTQDNCSSESQARSLQPAMALDALSTFLLFWLALLTTNDSKTLALSQYLLKLVHQTQINNTLRNKGYLTGFSNRRDSMLSPQSSSRSLPHHMEFIAAAFENTDIKISLRALRKERQQQQHLFDNTNSAIPEEFSFGDSNAVSTVKAVTGTTPTNQKVSTKTKGAETDGRLEDEGPFIPDDCIESNPLYKKKPKRIRKLFRRKKRNGSKGVSGSNNIIGLKNSSNDTNEKDGAELDTTLQPSLQSEEEKSAKVPDPRSTSMILEELGSANLSLSTDSLFANTSRFLEELEIVCVNIEKSLMQSFSQKFARWALQPWTPNKESALAEVTGAMRERLERCNRTNHSMPLLDPIDSSSEPLLSIDTNGCYILPSAHFPLLLTFDCERDNGSRENVSMHFNINTKNERTLSPLLGEERNYRTSVELVSLQGSRVVGKKETPSLRKFTVHGSVAGSVIESQQSVGIDRDSNRHIWDSANVMVFDSRSTWGPPKTLSLRVSQHVLRPIGKESTKSDKSTKENRYFQQECGFCWINLTPYWEQTIDWQDATAQDVTCKARVVPSDFFKTFDQHGDLPKASLPEGTEYMVIELRIKTRVLKMKNSIKRSLLYKHDDDVRQEMFAIEFLKSCDRILRSCGLDMKMLIFRAIPVGKKRGFIEWVQGSVPLSEICQPFAGSIWAKKRDAGKKVQSITFGNPELEEISDDEDFENDNESIALSSVAKAGVNTYESLKRVQTEAESMEQASPDTSYVLLNNNNPIQDFLRSLAYDPDGAYKIQRDVMDAYVKSCAGYSVCTYILGVGDRHLDNLLLHESGHFFHCDYSFILGQDPKKYLPMRITQDMINGMGGWKSDNFCQFSSLACATFLTLRRPENVRHLLSLIRLMEGCGLPDLEKTQSIGNAIQGVRDRLRLDLNDEEAIVFMEKLIEDSCSSKMWIAVDAIHSLAQRF